MPPLGVTGLSVGGNEGLWENLHVLRIYGYPDETDIVIVWLGEITRSLAAKVTQESTFGGAGWQANIRLPAMPETR